MVACSVPLFAQTKAQPSPLTGLIQEGLDRNLRLLAQRFEIPIAEARILQARLRPNPTLLLQWQYVDTFGIGFNEDNPAGPPETDIGLILPFIRGGKRARRIDEATSAKGVSEAAFLDATRRLVLDVQMAYVDYLVLEDNLQLYQASEAAFQRIVANKRLQVEAGTLPRVDLLRTEVALIQYQNQVAQAALRFQASKYRIQTLLGRTTMDPAFDIDDDFAFPDEQPNFDVLRAEAFEKRPDLAAARREEQRSEAYARLQRANAKQDQTLYAWYNRQYNIGIRNGSSMTFTWYAPLPVSDRNQGEIARADQQIRQARARRQALEQQIAEEVAVLRDRFTTTLGSVQRIETEMLGRAREARDLLQDSYTRGSATLVEFLDAQRAFLDASLAWNEARAEHARTLFLIRALTASGG